MKAVSARVTMRLLAAAFVAGGAVGVGAAPGLCARRQINRGKRFTVAAEFS